MKFSRTGVLIVIMGAIITAFSITKRFLNCLKDRQRILLVPWNQWKNSRVRWSLDFRLTYIFPASVFCTFLSDFQPEVVKLLFGVCRDRQNSIFIVKQGNICILVSRVRLKRKTKTKTSGT